jgi:hypothetical protein
MKVKPIINHKTCSGPRNGGTVPYIYIHCVYIYIYIHIMIIYLYILGHIFVGLGRMIGSSNKSVPEMAIDT